MNNTCKVPGPLGLAFLLQHTRHNFRIDFPEGVESMAYKIAYGNEFRKQKQKKHPNIRLRVLTAGFFLLFLVLSHLLWPDKLATARAVLLPEGSAVAALVEDLQSGEGFSEAVEAFCQQVIGHGQ